MAKESEQGPRPLERDTDAVLEQWVVDFRDRLKTLTVQIHYASSRGGEITPEEVETAYHQLMAPANRSRSSAQENVTIAFQENRFIQMAGFGMALALFVFGMLMLGYSAFGPTDAVGRIASLVGGSFAEILLLLPLRFAVNARRHNFAIRILGNLLDRVDNPRLLAELIRRLIGEVAPEKHQND